MNKIIHDPIGIIVMFSVIVFAIIFIYIFTIKRYRWIKTIKIGDYVAMHTGDRAHHGYVYKIENGIYYIYVRGMGGSVSYYSSSKHWLFEPQSI